MQAMVFAAGLGTRLKPLTDTMPKALVPVGGVPLLQRVLQKLNDEGATRVVVNVHHMASQIVNFLDVHQHFGMDIKISDETDALLDTGGGLRKAAALFDPDKPILIHNVDILSNICLRDFYDASKDYDATLLVSSRETSRYLLFDQEMRLVGWTNVKTGEVRSPYPDLDVSQCCRYAFSGIHVFSPRLFEQMEGWPQKFSIIDFYLNICAQAKVQGYVKDDLKLMDVGKIDTLDQADSFLKQMGGG